MIQITDWVATVPAADKRLAYVGENEADSRQFLLTGEAGVACRDWGFHLDMAFDLSTVTTTDTTQTQTTQETQQESISETAVSLTASTTRSTKQVTDVTVDCQSPTDVAALEKTVTEEGLLLTWVILRQHTLLPGKLRATLRAVSPTGQVKKTAIMVFDVEPAVVAEPAATVPQSEFETMERRMDTLAQSAATSAETAAASATSAAKSEQAAAEYVLELATRGKIINGCFEQPVVSPNLFDPQAGTEGVGMAATGKEYTGSAYMLTDYIPVLTGDVLTCQANNTSGNGDRFIQNMRWVCAFDAQKNLLSNAGSNDALSSYTVPDGVVFVRITIGGYPALTEVAIVKSAEIIPYEPYGAQCMLKAEAHNTAYITGLIKSETDHITGLIESETAYITALIKSETQPKSRRLALPSTLYAFANQPIALYFRNFMDYEPSSVYIQTYTSEGKQYADRWEYTPTKAKDGNMAFRVYDHDYALLNDQTFAFLRKNTTEKDSLTVLVLGDSTVNVGKETQKMLDLAAADGYDLTLLGTRGTAPNLHEGRGGWKAETYVTKATSTDGTVVNAFYNPGSATFDFGYYMAQQGYSGVDCVFIQLGINDMFGAWPVDRDTYIDTFITNMERIVSSIHAYDSRIKIVINLIIPCGDDQDAFTGYYSLATTWNCKKNVYEANLALLDAFANRTNVYLSPFNAAIDAVNNLNGDVHPNADGYAQLGTQMYSYMRAIN